MLTAQFEEIFLAALSNNLRARADEWVGELLALKGGAGAAAWELFGPFLC